MAYATESQKTQMGDPVIVDEYMKLSDFAGLDIIKVPNLVTNLTVVGPDLALLGYNITVINIGQFDINSIKVNDTLLGNYTVSDLTPGQNETLDPYPYYIITPRDINRCYIENIVETTGKNGSLEYIGPFYAYANFPMTAKNTETYLKMYSFELLKYGANLTEAGDAESLQDFEEKIRIQDNRLMSFREALNSDWVPCI